MVDRVSRLSHDKCVISNQSKLLKLYSDAEAHPFTLEELVRAQHNPTPAPSAGFSNAVESIPFVLRYCRSNVTAFLAAISRAPLPSHVPARLRIAWRNSSPTTLSLVSRANRYSFKHHLNNGRNSNVGSGGGNVVVAASSGVSRHMNCSSIQFNTLMLHNLV